MDSGRRGVDDFALTQFKGAPAQPKPPYGDLALRRPLAGSGVAREVSRSSPGACEPSQPQPRRPTGVRPRHPGAVSYRLACGVGRLRGALRPSLRDCVDTALGSVRFVSALGAFRQPHFPFVSALVAKGVPSCTEGHLTGWGSAGSGWHERQPAVAGPAVRNWGATGAH